MEETMPRYIRPSVRIILQDIIDDLRMASTSTARYSVKPKTLTLLELCQTITDYRRPPPSMTSYQYQHSPNTAHILTRRLYLHPLTINPSARQHASRFVPTAIDTEQRQQSNLGKNRSARNSTKKSHQDLSILSSSLPLITRLNTKIDNRPIRESASLMIDEDNTMTNDESSTNLQQTFRSISRGTTSSMHTLCNRASRATNKTNHHHQHYPEKVDVWQQFDEAFFRPMPCDPPTTPRTVYSEVYREEDEDEEEPSSSSNFIREITICRRRQQALNKNNNNNNNVE